MKKQIIIFIDSGDTIIDEATQVYDQREIVTHAEFIDGAKEMLETLKAEGHQVVLVADGEEESFENVYRENGLRNIFDGWVVSETVGEQKPATSMFQTAMEQLRLTNADKARIVMVGNNLKKDIAGANRFGLTSIWLTWSPRYFHQIEEPDWQPDITINTPMELISVIHKLSGEQDSE